MRGRVPAAPGSPKATDSNLTNNELRFVWTTSKCHTVKIDLQASVVLDRGSSQMWGTSPSSTGNSVIIPAVPKSRYIDYLGDLNIEKLSTILINFLANKASPTIGDLLPGQLRAASSSS